MVNVGGRSKGCSTCRRKHVKCDETRPTCLRCQRLGFECDGPKELIFIDATIVASRRKAGRPRGALLETPSASFQDASATTQLMRLSASIPENPHEHYIMFTRSHLTKDGPVDIALRELQARDISQLGASGTTDWQTAHLQAVLSFATILFGTKHRQPDITQEGYISHGATLQQLNRALSRPDCYQSDEIIVSVTTLAIQETLVPSGPSLFMSHMEGMEKLLALRDPRLHCSPTSVSLYRCLRYMLLFASLTAGTPSILAKSNWKAMFHKHCVNEKEIAEQQLYDILADCSVLAFERGELLKRWEVGGDNLNAQLDDIRHNAQTVYDQLQAWRRHWNTDPANAYIEVPASWISSHSDRRPGNDVGDTAPSDIVFPNTTSALMLMLYNIALINLLKILFSLPIEARYLTFHQDLIAATHSAVLEVYQSLPHASNAEWHKELHAAPIVYWAEQSARMILWGDESAEAKWLMESFNRKSVTTVDATLNVV